MGRPERYAGRAVIVLGGAPRRHLVQAGDALVERKAAGHQAAQALGQPTREIRIVLQADILAAQAMFIAQRLGERLRGRLQERQRDVVCRGQGVASRSVAPRSA